MVLLLPNLWHQFTGWGVQVDADLRNADYPVHEWACECLKLSHQPPGDLLIQAALNLEGWELDRGLGTRDTLNLSSTEPRLSAGCVILSTNRMTAEETPREV